MKPILNAKTGYIDTTAIYEPDVNIYFILGQRSDGKTYGFIHDGIDTYIKDDLPFAYIRRFDESLKKYTIQDLCQPHRKFIVKATSNKWDNTAIKSKRFYFTSTEGETVLTDKKPFMYCYSLNTWETAKGPDSGQFSMVIFDECVSASKYLPNEYIAFENVLSSILRNRKNTKIILLGNPINQICPYFDEYDIDPHKLKPGDIVYRISSRGEKMKFVYVPPLNESKISRLFSFNRRSSITTGYWDFGEFPRLESGMIKNSEFLGEFHVIFKRQFAVCEFRYFNGVVFAFWRPGNPDKIVDDRETPTFSDVHLFQPNIFTAWDSFSEYGRLLGDIIKSNRQYFADNKTGNLVKMWYNEFCMRAGVFR